MKFTKGFTLIEILIVVALMGILASIAIPAYNSYVLRGKLVEASTQLSDLRVKLEQSFQDNRNYITYVDANCKYITGTNVGQFAVAAHKYFTYTCTTAQNPGSTPADTYTLTAASNAGQGLGAAGDYTYTLDYTNAKVTVKFGGQTVNASCWLTKQGDSC
jgi:type IV pilus assembly protein PilE